MRFSVLAFLFALPVYAQMHIGGELKQAAVENLAGNPTEGLISGRLYFNTLTGQMSVYDGTVWKEAALSPAGTLTTDDVILRWDAVSDSIQESVVTISDAGVVSGVSTPVATTDAANKDYVDTATAGAGDVVGPASVTDGRLAVFSGTDGKALAEGNISLPPDLGTAAYPLITNADGTTRWGGNQVATSNLNGSIIRILGDAGGNTSQWGLSIDTDSGSGNFFAPLELKNKNSGPAASVMNLFERNYEAEGGNYIAIQVPPLATDYQLRLPPSTGSVGQALVRSNIGSATAALAFQDVGDVSGPVSSSNKGLPRFSDTSGDTLEDSGVTIVDAGSTKIIEPTSSSDDLALQSQNPITINGSSVSFTNKPVTDVEYMRYTAKTAEPTNCPLGATFYNSTNEYMCFCNNTNVARQMHAPTTACF